MNSSISKLTFSVITPAYNTAKYIGGCIESVINTGYDLTKIEHIIVDDGSSDDTSAVVKRYAKKYPHIKLYRKKNSNWGGVMNYVKDNKLIHNEYATICDSDDQITKRAFDEINKYAENNDLIFGCFYRWNGKKQLFPVHTYYYLHSCDVYSKSECKNIPPFVWLLHGVYFKKELFYKAEDLKENVYYQDNILLTYLFTKAKSIKYVNKMLAKYYSTRPNNSSDFINNNSSTLILLDNLQQMAKYDLSTTIALSLIYFSKLRKYCLKHNIKFSCSNPPRFNNSNFIVRFFCWLAYRFTRTFKLFQKINDKNSNKKISLKKFKKAPKKVKNHKT